MADSLTPHFIGATSELNWSQSEIFHLDGDVSPFVLKVTTQK